MKHLLVLIFIFLALPIVVSQEEITQNQLIVEIYVAESGRALVTGYVSEDALNSLPFLAGSNYVFYNDTSEIYAVTDALTSKEGGTWTLNFSIDGYYLHYSCYIYLPPEAEITDFSFPEDFSYTFGVENSSIVIEIEGVQAPSPQVLVYYRQPLTEDSEEPLKEEATGLLAIVYHYRDCHSGINRIRIKSGCNCLWRSGTKDLIGYSYFTDVVELNLPLSH